MEIRTTASVRHPRDRVFETYRDRLEELVPYLPNIQSIHVERRDEAPDGTVELVNVWRGGGDIPAALRSVLSESMLSWTDYATWHPDRWVCAWRTEVHAVPGAVLASGENRFRADGDEETVVEIAGDLRCDPDALTMAPRFARKKVASTLEKVLVGKIGPNLAEVAAGVGKLLDG